MERRESNPGYVNVSDEWITIQACDTENLKRIFFTAAGTRQLLIGVELEKRGWRAPRITSKSLEWQRIEPK